MGEPVIAGMRRNPLTARRTGRPQNASVSGGASFSDFSELFGMGAPVFEREIDPERGVIEVELIPGFLED